MASTTLLKKKTETFTGKELTKYLNEERGKNYEDLTEALVGLGVATAGVVLVNPLAVQMAGILGLGIATATVIEVIEDGMDSKKLASVLEDVGDNGTLQVTTSFYEWLSGSGNHTGYYSETTYKAI